MSVPGSNLLNQALTVIARQTIGYFKALSRTQNSVGQDVTSYAVPVLIVGSFQPVPRALYEAYGLDFQKDYYTFYTSNDLIDINRNLSNDMITFNNATYQCESSNDWFVLDGWVGVLCCLVQNPAPGGQIFGFGTVPSSNNNQNFGNGCFYA